MPLLWKKKKPFKHFRGCIGKADPSFDQTDVEFKKFYAGSKKYDSLKWTV